MGAINKENKEQIKKTEKIVFNFNTKKKESRKQKRVREQQEKAEKQEAIKKSGEASKKQEGEIKKIIEEIKKQKKAIEENKDLQEKNIKCISNYKEIARKYHEIACNLLLEKPEDERKIRYYLSNEKCYKNSVMIFRNRLTFLQNAQKNNQEFLSRLNEKLSLLQKLKGAEVNIVTNSQKNRRTF